MRAFKEVKNRLRKSKEDLSERLNKLERSIKSAEGNDDHLLLKHKKQIKSTLMHCGIELFSCVLAGLLFGLLVDKYFETKPLFIIVGFMLGVATAFYNIIKLVRK
ncbi:MAG: AtpZ/AtpI family protein [Holosporales bacterium]|nr:AtpZ/AtpI family protein [Holosporales bacterium]